MPKYVVIVDWVDGDVEDSDEVKVQAKTAAGATSAARAWWRRSVSASWPQCRDQKVWVLTDRRARNLI